MKAVRIIEGVSLPHLESSINAYITTNNGVLIEDVKVIEVTQPNSAGQHNIKFAAILTIK